jgi:hypothetical protein
MDIGYWDNKSYFDKPKALYYRAKRKRRMSKNRFLVPNGSYNPKF